MSPKTTILSIFLAFLTLGFSSLAQADLKKSSQKVCISSYCYFVKNGTVYWSQRPARGGRVRGTSMPSSFNTRSVIVYADRLVTLQKNGKIEFWTTDSTGESYWVFVKGVENVSQLYTFGSGLLAVTHDGRLLVHLNRLKGDFSKVAVMDDVHAEVKVDFKDSGMRRVESLSESDGEILPNLSVEYGAVFREVDSVGRTVKGLLLRKKGLMFDAPINNRPPVLGEIDIMGDFQKSEIFGVRMLYSNRGSLKAEALTIAQSEITESQALDDLYVARDVEIRIYNRVRGRSQTYLVWPNLSSSEASDWYFLISDKNWLR